MTDKQHVIISAVMLAIGLCVGATAWLDKHIGEAFILRAPQLKVEASSLHCDTANEGSFNSRGKIQLWGATEDGFEHCTHELETR